MIRLFVQCMSVTLAFRIILKKIIQDTLLIIWFDASGRCCFVLLFLFLLFFFLRCPSTYHSSSYCIPAGTIVLSTKQVVCVRHLESTKYNKTVNTTWCFLCSSGGDLICCETCPTSVHPKCLVSNANRF